MQKNMGKLPQISEKIQVECKWKLIGICNNPQVVPNHKLLSNGKHENKHVTGSPRGRNDTASLGKSCRGITVASQNEVVPITNISKPTTDEEMQKSRQLLDALEILDSNSELFRKLLQNPNSLLMKRFRNKKDLKQTEETAPRKLLECGDSSIPNKCREPEHNVHKPLSDRIKSKFPLKDDEILCSSNSVVVLKPNQKEHRRRKPEKHREIGSTSRAEIASTSGSVGNTVQSSTVSCSNRRDLEAKRRLSKRLRHVEKRESLSDKHTTTTLRRILSSPLSSPRHDLGVTSSTNMEADPQTKSPCCSTNQSCESNKLPLGNEDISTTTNYTKPDDSLQIFSSTDGLSSDASIKNTKVNDISTNPSETPSKRSNVHFTNAEESTNTTKIQNEYQNTKCTIEDILFHNRTSKSSLDTSTPNPVSKYKVDTCESFTDTEEDLSPVSVLDSLFSEDVTSRSSKINKLDKSQVQPVRIDFEEESVTVDPIDYRTNLCSCIRTLLQASELNWEELSKNARSSGQLFNLFSNDKKDLFTDFINDILLEVNENNVECITWSSFIRPDTQAFSVLGKNVVEEVMKEIQWYLVPSVLPRTREHLVEKDMEKPIYWSGTKLDTEDIVIQIVDHVLDESIMDNIFALME